MKITMLYGNIATDLTCIKFYNVLYSILLDWESKVEIHK